MWRKGNRHCECTNFKIILSRVKKNFCGYSISWKVDQTQKTAIADDADSVNSSLMQDQWPMVRRQVALYPGRLSGLGTRLEDRQQTIE